MHSVPCSYIAKKELPTLSRRAELVRGQPSPLVTCLDETIIRVLEEKMLERSWHLFALSKSMHSLLACPCKRRIKTLLVVKGVFSTCLNSQAAQAAVPVNSIPDSRYGWQEPSDLHLAFPVTYYIVFLFDFSNIFSRTNTRE